MRSRATIPLIVLLLLLFGVTKSAFAQDAPELGDEFIFFVNGPNIQIPEVNASVVNDPLDPGSANKVARFDHGDFTFAGFRFERTEGVDLTPNLADGDSLYFRLLSDPANAGQPNVTITFTDKTDDSGANDGSADLEFRAQWVIPQEFHDGTWHDVAIPLPPATFQELEDAKEAGTLDDLADNWVYGGAWSVGGFPVALDGLGPNTAQAPELWEEFEWSNVSVLGAFFDHNTGIGGPIYLDDVYIGDDNTDLSVASDPPSALSGASGMADGPVNVVSWTPQEEFGGYNVYVSATPITDVDAQGVQLIATVPFDAEDFSVEHQFEVPHPSLAPLPLYYAVTSLSAFGVENSDVSNTAFEIANEDLPVQPYILQLTEAEGEILFNNLSQGIVSSEGFPEGLAPFTINEDRITAGDVAVLPESNEDFSASVIMGYTDLNELFIYGEVTDDVIEFGGENNTGADAWQFDSFEMGWGNYDVRFIPEGGLLVGSPHQDFQRGEEPDYQFRITAFDDAAGNLIGTSTFVTTGTGPTGEGEVQGGGSIFETTVDGSGNVTGYKFLSLIPLDAIQFSGSGDAVLPPPTGEELRLLPMNVAFNDADGNTREHQVLWSTKGNAGANWWNTPNQWLTVAMAGRGTAVSTEDGEQPVAFSLEQNYPNPFNPSTQIRFTLGATETVNLAVYDMLGRKVASLVSGRTLPAGAHAVSFDASDLASGIYVYRMEAGSFSQTRRMILIK